MRHLFSEPSRDDELGAALRSAEAVPSDDAEALHQRITVAAAARLSGFWRPDSRTQWWECLSAWTKFAVPAAATLALGAALLIPSVQPDDTAAVAADADTTVMAALFSDPAGRGALAAGLIAPADHDWVLTQVMQQ